MIPPLFGKQEVGIWWVQKHIPRNGVFRHIFLSNYWLQRSDIWSQASYRYPISWDMFLDPSDSYFLFAEEWGYHKWALDTNVRSMCIKINKIGKQEVGIWWVQKHSPRYGVPIDPSDSYFLFADLVGFYTHWTYMYMHIFRHIFLSNYWLQRSDIWSQASYRYPISWEAFLDPSDSYFLFSEEQGYHKWALAHSSSCSVHIFNFHINQLYFAIFFLTITANRKYESDGSKNASHDMGYLYQACDQISDFCHR
jgi:hypothetical protein